MSASPSETGRRVCQSIRNWFACLPVRQRLVRVYASPSETGPRVWESTRNWSACLRVCHRLVRIVYQSAKDWSSCMPVRQSLVRMSARPLEAGPHVCQSARDWSACLPVRQRLVRVSASTPETGPRVWQLLFKDPLLFHGPPSDGLAGPPHRPQVWPFPLLAMHLSWRLRGLIPMIWIPALDLVGRWP